MFSKKQVNDAMRLYHECGSVTRTIHILGYPSREMLYQWIRKEGKPKPDRKAAKITNTKEHLRNPSADVKLDAIRRCFEYGESIKSVSEEIGYSRASIYIWRKKYLREGAGSLVNNRNIKIDKLPDKFAEITSEEVELLRRQMSDLQMEIDILKETINILKKDPGVDWTALKNREKAVVIDAMKSKYPLPLLLTKFALSKSSYYYQKHAAMKEDKYKELSSKIIKIFDENRKCYGYRRVYGELTKQGVIISEKVIRRIMKSVGLEVKTRKNKKYYSYQGEISLAVPNHVERNFHADSPNVLFLTDITEFAIPSGKVYLSPMVDCFDGILVTWGISTSPNADLVNSMLDGTISKLRENENPIIHTDRGCHYRWPGWIERMERRGLNRSMSKKGCSPDNAACEGVFGRIKNEMFYNRGWDDVTIDEFMAILDEYLHWYNEKRIKQSLGYMSPVEFRQSLGLAA
jgi:transposase InsO family protein/transposase-like protein